MRGIGAITPSWLADFETRMQFLSERSYVSLNDDSWWRNFLSVRTIGSGREILTWLLSTAQIKFEGKAGGNKHFEELVSQFTTIETKHAGSGLRLNKDKLLDTDANGVDMAAQWASDMGEYMAYWPQKLAADLMMNGHDATKYKAYDGVALYSTAHPYNPFKTSAGNYSNLFTVGDFSTLTYDLALKALMGVFTKMAAIKMPNGKDPRRIRPADIYCGPLLFPIMCQLTDAKFLASAAAAGGGSADTTQILKRLGFATPILVDELQGFENDTTFFVGAKQRVGSQLGAGVYVEREPFSIGYYTGDGGGTGVDALLRRLKELEWDLDGRNMVAPGHPYLSFKCKAA